jgi:surface antigen
MRIRCKQIIFALTISVLVSGCETMEGNKQGGGTAIGAVIGGFIGSKLGDDDHKQLAILVGAGLGAYIGNQIGKHLDDQDKQRLALETRKSLQTGQPTEWENPETGVKGEVKVKETHASEAKSQVRVLKDRVKEVPPLDIRDSGVYVVKKQSNVRGGPSTEYVVVESLNPKTNVDVLGKVESQPWYLIGKGDIAKGFVYAPLLKQTGQPIDTSTVSDYKESELGNVEVSAKRNCRTVEQKVILKDGSEVSDTITACQQADGSWS